MKFKKSESGRSMVEMLGVLAIIGVLSVGGIAGYSLAMRRHRANGVVDLAGKFALLAYNNYQQELINGKISNSTGNQSIYVSLTFDNAEIGNLPTGVIHIGGSGIYPDTTTGIDTIHVSARFDDDKLCQAVGAIVGKNCNNGSVRIDIKQN